MKHIVSYYLIKLARNMIVNIIRGHSNNRRHIIGGEGVRNSVTIWRKGQGGGRVN